MELAAFRNVLGDESFFVVLPGLDGFVLGHIQQIYETQ
jgi:hypothetical protein